MFSIITRFAALAGTITLCLTPLQSIAQSDPLSSAETAAIARLRPFRPFYEVSMANYPTTVPGDYFFTDTFANYFKSGPVAGDQIVFIGDDNQSYIFRIIGVAGDSISIQDSALTINGVKVERTFVETRMADWLGNGHPGEVEIWSETLANGATYQVAEASLSRPVRANFMEEVIVPQNSVFVMGDNRDNALDSRFPPIRGFVPVDTIVGKIVTVIPFGSAFSN